MPRPPLDGLRLLEVTTAWAGPFVGNLLGALGMDVVKFEALPPFDGYRVLRLHTDSDPPAVAELKADNRWFEASALHNAVNRNKRGVVVDLRADEGRRAVPRAGPHRRRGAVQLHRQGAARAGPRLRRPRRGQPAASSSCACRRSAPSVRTAPRPATAPVVEGMGGFGARFGYEDEGARISDLYWPDPVAGAHAALAVLTGIERRDRTGAGCEIDLAHMEVMWSALGEGLVVADQRGTDIGRMGNREPGVAGVRLRRRRRRAVGRRGRSGRGRAAAAASAGRPWPDVVAAIRAAGGAAEVVNEVLDAVADPRLADRFELVDHPVTGPVRHVRVAVRRRRRVDHDPPPCPAVRRAHRRGARRTRRLRCAAAGDLRDAGVIGGVLPRPPTSGCDGGSRRPARQRFR